MQSETEWIGRADQDEENSAAQRYEHFMKPEPREGLGPIEVIDDEFLGPNTKVRDMLVGMTRNAKTEDKKKMRIYLQPFPHIRLGKGKPLQGWYKGADEKDGVRPRPCFSEAVLTEPYGGYCLPGETLVATPKGDKRIDCLAVGDKVYGVKDGAVVETDVLGWLLVPKMKPLVRLETSEGSLTLTGDHPVYSLERNDYVKAEELRLGERIDSFEAGSGEREEAGVTGITRLNDSVVYDIETTTSNFLARSPDQPTYFHVHNCAVGCSFAIASGQFVDSPSGPILIDELKTGDVVWGRTNAGVEPVEVGEVAKLWNSKVLKVQTPNGVLRLTGDHPVFANGEWTQAENLKPGDLLERLPSVSESDEQEVLLMGMPAHPMRPAEIENTRIDSIEEEEGGWVYDFETASENYYVDGLLVHNCYINSGVRGYRGTGLISVPLHYGNQVKKQIKKARRMSAGYFSSFTDPFTPLEQYYHNTQQGAEAFVEQGLPIFFLSRLPYPTWAIDLLTQNKYSYAQKSINTSCPDDWRKLSPGAMSLEDHLNEISILKDEGIYVSIQVNPIVPGVTSNAQIVKLFKMLKEAGADHVIVKFVEAGYSWAPEMVKRHTKRFGKERGAAFAKLFTDNQGGQRCVQEEYRLNAHRIFQRQATKLGLTYATCYEYRYERNDDGSIKSKTGVSIGREFTTADQCHGQRVPMFTRSSDDVPFTEVEECPPSGCLYCAKENGGEPRCGDPTAGSAPAMRAKHYQQPIPALVQIGVPKRK